jgi:thiamine-phosphate pyrophosphorylase
MSDASVYRILDANLNRLREALRVIEEYVRFVDTSESLSIRCKTLRHSLEDMEAGFGPENLLAGRDTGSDPFAGENRPEELVRATPADVASAGFKRGQEAARVIEEYAKLTEHAHFSDTAKSLRFSLYSLEKDVVTHGRKKTG